MMNKHLIDSSPSTLHNPTTGTVEKRLPNAQAFMRCTGCRERSYIGEVQPREHQPLLGGTALRTL